MSSPITIEYVEWGDPRTVALRGAMDVEMSALYAERTASFPAGTDDAISKALAVDPSTIAATILALDGDIPIGHSALRPFEGSLEVKKVFVDASARGRGVSKLMMLELESYALAHGVNSLVLQTGPLQGPAIALYENLGYVPIPVYGAYGVIPFALCFRKDL